MQIVLISCKVYQLLPPGRIAVSIDGGLERGADRLFKRVEFFQGYGKQIISRGNARKARSEGGRVCQPFRILNTRRDERRQFSRGREQNHPPAHESAQRGKPCRYSRFALSAQKRADFLDTEISRAPGF